MNFLNGKKTLITSIIGIVFGLLLAFGIDLKSYGITEDQISGIIMTIGALIAIFLGNKIISGKGTNPKPTTITGWNLSTNRNSPT